ncbi:unnamed protein product [Leuciscus chuanchicus]
MAAVINKHSSSVHGCYQALLPLMMHKPGHKSHATLLEEIFKDAHGSSQSSITGQRGIQRRGPEDQPAHSSKAAHSDTEHKHPWGEDQAVACYENRAVEGIKAIIYSAWAGEISASLAAGSPSPLRN